MLNVCLLGTAGQFPRPDRYLSSVYLCIDGIGVLLDCGEGTQIALRSASISCNKIDYICITHYHADHVSGLLGILLAIHNHGRTKPVTIIGPPGLYKVYYAATKITSELSYDVILQTIRGNDFCVRLKNAIIKPFRVYHNVVCYGYNIELFRKPKFFVEKANKLKIPQKLWTDLIEGHPMLVNGHLIEPSMVCGKPRKGIKVSFCTDTRPNKSIIENIMGADLFICEAMYPKETKYEKVCATQHMYMYEAAELAKAGKVKEIWLTHFSQANVCPESELHELRNIFPNLQVGRDGMKKEIQFEKDGEEQRDEDFKGPEFPAEENIIRKFSGTVNDIDVNAIISTI